MENNFDLVEKHRLSVKAYGGTELMLARLYGGDVPRELLEKFQIIPTRLSSDLQSDKYRLYYCHDLVEDEEVKNALSNDGWRRFHLIIGVSNWQVQQLISIFGIPWSRTIVMQNAIEPIEPVNPKDNSTIRLIYTSTPNRGLNVLLPVFKKLHESFPNLRLDVFSSFATYGWSHRDENYKQLLDDADQHPAINNHGYQPPEVVRKAVANAHIFTLPSMWRETSCLCLMEAMSAGLLCVHPNLGALFETSANWTHMYNWHEAPQQHAEIFYSILHDAITNLFSEPIQQRCKSQSVYTNAFYNWKVRARQWESLLTNIINANLPKEIPKPQYVYSY